MRFPPSFLEEIKARLPVSEVVRRRVKLMKSGREWKGLSPFNAEKTPSFFVNDQKMAWFDFSSGKNGNIFDFVMATDGLSFPETVERLAADAGLPLPTVTRETEEQEIKRASLHEVLEQAALFFETHLHGRLGQRARTYLDQRGLGLDTQKQFRVGYAPAEKYALRDALAAKGITVEAMIETGLLIHGDEIAVPYDKFRDRVIFPICDRSGRVIAFGGRTLDKDGQPKYLNSPETPLFHKGSVLYNHHRARKAAHERGGVIVVEGYVDVISMSNAGFPQCVAPLGTALTPDQCELLWKMAEEPVLCFDGDRAGRKAAYRAMDMALPLIGNGRSLRFALLPDGQDPDDLARSGGGGAIQSVIGQALPLVDLIWMRETEGVDFHTPERRAAFHRRLGEIARTITDETLRHYYQAEFKTRLDTLFGADRAVQVRDRGAPPRGQFGASRFETSRFGGFGNRRGFGPGDEAKSLAAAPSVSTSLARSALFRPATAGLPPREALILLLLLNHPALIETYLEDIAALELSTPEAAKFREKLLGLAGREGLDHHGLGAELAQSGFEPFQRKLESISALASHWYMDPKASDADAEEVLKQALTLHHKARALHRELQLAELALGNDASELNLARLKDIQEQLSALSGMEAAVEGFGALSGHPSGSL
ncbi:DNA primase [Methyloferula stellata]|uniref:DNA primase n=1 Tax=Methyloferula stellata TaxID=876270 RepID=UPI0003713C1E|nr:DNA primase [Methyloferula stellata]